MHLSIEAIVDDELVSHLDAEWLHWMFLAIEVGANLCVVEIGNSACRHTAYLL